jgi:hypothetical protein
LCTKQKERPRRECMSRPSFPTNWPLGGGTQQLHRSMQEEVRPQYEDAVTKPSYCFPRGQLRFCANIFQSPTACLQRSMTFPSQRTIIIRE